MLTRGLATNLLFATAALGLALGIGVPRGVRSTWAQAGNAPVSPLDGQGCGAWDVDYKFVAGTQIKVSDTVMKAGDGTYDVGPGALRIRFADERGQPGSGTAKLLALELTTRFTVESTVLGVKTTVRTDTVSHNMPDEAGVVATGKLDGERLVWLGPASGYRSDGTLHCAGMLCGKLGAPPPGESPVRIGPYPVSYKTFVFSDGISKVDMPFAQVAQTKHPKQTTSLRIVAVETSRRCAKKRP